MSKQPSVVNKSAAPTPVMDQSKIITIQRTDLSSFDDAFSFLREKFAAEMKRIEEEMDRLRYGIRNCYIGMAPSVPMVYSSELRKMHHQQLVQPSNVHPVAMTSQNETKAWEAINSSPLIQGEGEDKMLRLQFDVSQFEPSEVRVIIEEDTLTVTAHHEENTEHSNVMRSFRRDFTLPKEVDPDSVISSLSRDGVLTIQAPISIVNKAGQNQVLTNQNLALPSQQQSLQRGGSKMSKSSARK